MKQKQTAVEWLDRWFRDNPEATHEEGNKALHHAKEMEKQQKMECWETAHQAGRFEGKGIAEENWQTFEQYYNEEYGKNNQSI